MQPSERCSTDFSFVVAIVVGLGRANDYQPARQLCCCVDCLLTISSDLDCDWKFSVVEFSAQGALQRCAAQLSLKLDATQTI